MGFVFEDLTVQSQPAKSPRLQLHRKLRDDLGESDPAVFIHDRDPFIELLLRCCGRCQKRQGERLVVLYGLQGPG